MLDIEKILVPTDFSSYADLALQKAIDLAESCSVPKAKIYLVYVWPEAPDVFKLSKYIAEGRKKIQKELEKQSQKYFDEQTAKVKNKAKVKIKTKVLQGSPYKEVIDFQEKIQADMVVIGTQGQAPLEGFLFGSTSSKIIRHATCSVMIVRKPKYAK